MRSPSSPSGRSTTRPPNDGIARSNKKLTKRKVKEVEEEIERDRLNELLSIGVIQPRYVHISYVNVV
jgi:hypothetical protein